MTLSYLLICPFIHSFSDSNFSILELDDGSVANPLLFEAGFLVGEWCFPMLDVALGGLDLYSGSWFVLLEELHLDNRFGIETLNFVTLLSSVDFIWFDSESDVLTLSLALLFIIIHDIIRFILVFGQSPFLGQLIDLDVLLDVIPYGSWFDWVEVDVISHDIIESQTSISSLPD